METAPIDFGINVVNNVVHTVFQGILNNINDIMNDIIDKISQESLNDNVMFCVMNDTVVNVEQLCHKLDS